MIIANQSGRTLKVNSAIRARITAVSLGKAASMGKIGITCRQPFLGANEWIEEEIKKASGETVSDLSDTKENSKKIKVEE
jgi:DNA-directed RNA polymerase subunit E'